MAHRRRDALAPVAIPLADGQSGSVRAADGPASANGNNRRSNSASSISSGIGQPSPAAAARRTYSPTAVLPIPVASLTSRRLIPSA
jgi:hypothetical protein